MRTAAGALRFSRHRAINGYDARVSDGRALASAIMTRWWPAFEWKRRDDAQALDAPHQELLVDDPIDRSGLTSCRSTGDRAS
jgi:hypothetical protein